MTRIKNNFLSIVMVLPVLLLFTFIIIYPVTQAVYLSFFKWDGILQSKMQLIGLKNYFTLFNDSNFRTSMRDVGIFILQGLLIQGPLAFILALIITTKLKAVNFFKTTFFIPVIIPLTAVALMWNFILNPDWGIISAVIRAIGFKNFNVEFLGDPKIAIYALVLVSAWVYVGMNMIIFAAGLTAIPEELHQAAEMDGATGFKKVIYITIPLLMESIKIYFITCITGSLKAFDLIYVMTQGGPNDSTQVPGVLMFKEAFSYNHFGYGNAIATVILVLGLIASILANKYMFTKT